VQIVVRLLVRQTGSNVLFVVSNKKQVNGEIDMALGGGFHLPGNFGGARYRVPNNGKYKCPDCHHRFYSYQLKKIGKTIEARCPFCNFLIKRVDVKE
jgi:DNA-directed RNA polymerase subunit RPC12/RpoP